MAFPFNYLKMIVAGFVLVMGSLALVLCQVIAMRTHKGLAQVFPRLWHRLILVCLGIRVRVRGERLMAGPGLIVANHVSYLDIPVLGSLGSTSPLRFIAKSEVRDWPVFGFLSTLQGTVFVERGRRAQTLEHRTKVRDRLDEGDLMVLFAEGTSSDGNRVLPFKSALISAAQDVAESGGSAMVQPVSIAYVRRFGMPMARRDRPFFAWYGDMDLAPHLLELLKEGPIEVEVLFHPPLDVSHFSTRKALTNACQSSVAQGVAEALAGREPGPAAIAAAKTEKQAA